MARRTIKQTLADLPDAPKGQPAASASYRREQAARAIERQYGRTALAALAELAFTDSDKTIRLKALLGLAPYLYPALKAIEVSGPDGASLTVEVRAVPTSSPGASPSPAAPALPPGDSSGNPSA